VPLNPRSYVVALALLAACSSSDPPVVDVARLGPACVDGVCPTGDVCVDFSRVDAALAKPRCVPATGSPCAFVDCRSAGACSVDERSPAVVRCGGR
jgi:hypothetical protein